MRARPISAHWNVAASTLFCVKYLRRRYPSRPRSVLEILGGLSEIELGLEREIHSCHPRCRGLGQFLWINLVEGIVGGVVYVEIVDAVLAQGDYRHAGVVTRRDIVTGIGRGLARQKDPERVQGIGEGLQ